MGIILDKLNYLLRERLDLGMTLLTAFIFMLYGINFISTYNSYILGTISIILGILFLITYPPLKKLKRDWLRISEILCVISIVFGIVGAIVTRWLECVMIVWPIILLEMDLGWKFENDGE